jgi:tetratricopeptide (TPR) repeat protein
MIAKPGTRLFDGPPGTKQSPYVALTTEGYSSLLEGTQAKLNGRHEQGKSLYKKALAAFRQAEEMRPNEASPKLGIAEASAHLWASVDANSVLKTIHAAEQLLLNGLSEGKINKFNGKDSVQYLYALCHLELKNRDLAKEHLRQALVINPEHRYAAGILKSVEEADSKKGACFVATAAYGTPLAPEVQTLRNFREEVIRKSSIGRSFIWSYGIVSPPLAKLISKSDILKKVARNLLIGPILRQIKARDK